MAEPRVTVSIGDREGGATARVVDPGTTEDALARRLLLAKYAQPGGDDLAGWAAAALPVANDLELHPG